jgi:hypothetical protein
MRPYAEDAPGQQWMLYDVARQEADQEPDEDAEDSEAEDAAPRRAGRARIERVRGQPVHSGSFDPRTSNFSLNPTDFPFQVRFVQGRTRCLCYGGTAGTRNVITPVALGTSAAVKVLGEGLVEALADANANATRSGHDGKERLLIYSDSRQDAAHRARFIIFASRYDRLRRRLFQILQNNPRLGLQRAVELLGEIGVRERDNPHGPDDPERRLTEDERLRVRARTVPLWRLLLAAGGGAQCHKDLGVA